MKRSEIRPDPVLRVAEDIVPIGTLKAHLSEQIRGLREHQRPLVVTQSGRPAAVLLAPEAFDRLTAQARFVAAVEAGLEDERAGRTVPDDALGQRLEARFGAPPRAGKK